MHSRGGLVRAQPEECRVTQVTVSRPLDEPDLRDERRSDPLDLRHLLGGDAATPVRGFSGGKIDEWTSNRMK